MPSSKFLLQHWNNIFRILFLVVVVEEEELRFKTTKFHSRNLKSAKVRPHPVMCNNNNSQKDSSDLIVSGRLIADDKNIYLINSENM